jgi:hypothetical protein
VIDTAPAADTTTGAVPVIAPPPDEVTQVGQVKAPVVRLRINGEEALTANVPLVFGSVRVGVLATAWATIEAEPLVAPPIANFIKTSNVFGLLPNKILSEPLARSFMAAVT